ncbi:MAG: hypothetical protein DWI57_13580 [Chloroflexi bacterium]|nr:MAG: hypothetical protein DWI57_13580 [Chloroflexota bacterium]
MYRRHLVIVVMLVLSILSNTKGALGAEDLPAPPIEKPRVGENASGHHEPAPPDTTPSLPQPGVLDPSDIYNNLLVADTLPSQTEGAGSGPAVSPIVSNLANGPTLTYHNAPKPTPCVNFNNKKKWASQIVVNGVRQGGPWTDHYAGWGSFAVNDGYYDSQFVIFSFDESIGRVISAKIGSSQPYAAGYASPLIPAAKGDDITVKVRYLLANTPLVSFASGKRAGDWVSLGIKPDAYADRADPNSAVFANGFVRGGWAELELSTQAKGEEFMVFLQAQSPAAINSNAYFDDVEISINSVPLLDCEFKESISFTKPFSKD